MKNISIKGKKIKMGEAYLGTSRRGVTQITLDSVSPDLSVGTVVSIQGKSKGKGFAGVMKRWNFAGGPRTHGQSDRARATGSIGQGTTPGRVRKNKKMPGRMGSDTKTVKNSLVLVIDGLNIWVTGPVPGAKNTELSLTITGKKDLENVILPGHIVTVEVAPSVESNSEEQPKQEEHNEN